MVQLRPTVPVCLALVLTTVLAGCLQGDDQLPDAGTGIIGLGAAGKDGAPDPQLTAHPAYGWPTMVDMGPLASKWKVPEYRELPATITGLVDVAHVEGGNSGSGIAVWGSYAFNSGGGGSNVGTVVDISDPEAPQKIADIPGEPFTRDADMMAFPDGRVILVMATNTNGNPIYDVTDPANPTKLVELEAAAGSHNIAVVPGTPIVYNAPSGGDTTEIWDLSDPEAPEAVQAWKNGYGCHDITFYIDPAQEKYRAYCAGVAVTQIWDIADPKNPEVIATIDPEILPVGGTAGPDYIGNGGLHHLAMVNHDASVLIIGDETGGGAAPGCDVYVDQGGMTKSGILGNLWFFDLADETNAVLKGWVSPESQAANAPQVPEGGTPNCTSHFGRIIEDRPIVAMAFYGAGVVLVDFSDLENPRIIDRWNPATNTWDVWYYQGYLITGDMARGMDILAFG